MRVIAQGRLQQRSYTDREGQQRTVVEMQVDEIGPSLWRAKAQVTRTSGGGQGGYNQGGGRGGYNQGAPQGGYQGGGQGGYGGQQASYNAPSGGAQDDPWATGGSTSFGDEPPF